MLAAAYSLVGYGPEAEDAVQEASLIALRGVGRIREPAAVGAWLRTVTRNACRMRLRAPRTASLDAAPGFAQSLRADGPEPGELLERQALRDWVWGALEQLPEPQRLAVVLRYFTGASSYQQIAEVSGVPVGTVRSRLSGARGRLARSMAASTDGAYDGAGAARQARERAAQETFGAVQQGEFAAAVADYWAPDVQVTWPSGTTTTGHAFLIGAMEQDRAAGVRMRLRNVVAGSDIVIWETDLISPAEDPQHCPPAAVWVQWLRAGRVGRVRLLHAPRPESAGAAPRAA
jgi:RNA polymerase sigma-70 factor (ECF subfamily)